MLARLLDLNEKRWQEEQLSGEAAAAAEAPKKSRGAGAKRAVGGKKLPGEAEPKAKKPKKAGAGGRTLFDEGA